MRGGGRTRHQGRVRADAVRHDPDFGGFTPARRRRRRPQRRICLDTWHTVKLKVAYDELRRIPPHCITSVELNDGTLECPWSLHEDTVNHRRLCGEGEFDVKGFIRAIQDAGYEGPWGIEVLSEELRKWPLERLTTRAFQTTMAQFTGTR